LSALSSSRLLQVWNEVLLLSRAPGVLDLGQGWPDYGADEVARRAAAAAILDESDARLNQYSVADGAPELREAVSEYYAATQGWQLDARSEVLVLTSATEGLYTVMQTFLNPGDEVIFVEPFFPWYLSHALLAGAVPVTVRLRPPLWQLDEAELERAFSPRTRLFVHNSPHNPSGHVSSAAELGAIARLCARHNVVAVADEVYEGKVFGERAEARLRDAPGMACRTLTLGTASKLLSLTGWRVGWVTGPAELLAGVKCLHSYATYCAPTPLQLGCAAALRARAAAAAAAREAGRPPPRDAAAEAYAASAELLSAALREVGLRVHEPEGGYFLIADVSATGLSGGEYCKQLISACAVASVPMEIFYAEGREAPPRSLVRFAVCKRAETVAEAARRIRANPLPLVQAAAS